MTCDPVGIAEIAERLGVEPQTAAAWKHRGLLPAPEWHVSRMPAWNWSTIAQWAEKTGRLRPPQSRAGPPGDTRPRAFVVRTRGGIGRVTCSCGSTFEDFEATLTHLILGHAFLAGSEQSPLVPFADVREIGPEG